MMYNSPSESRLQVDRIARELQLLGRFDACERRLVTDQLWSLITGFQGTGLSSTKVTLIDPRSSDQRVTSRTEEHISQRETQPNVALNRSAAPMSRTAEHRNVVGPALAS